MSLSSIKITFTLALLTGLLMGFQNCSLSKFTGGVSDGTASASSAGPTTTGGFDGSNPGGQGGTTPTGGTDNVTTGGRYDADRALREVESRLMELAALRRRL